MLQIQAMDLSGVGVRHFIDSNPARQCMVKARSKHSDLNQLAGMLWFTAGKVLRNYSCQHVASKLNLAGAPSRGQFSTVKQLGARIIRTDFAECIEGIDSWMSSMHVSALVG